MFVMDKSVLKELVKQEIQEIVGRDDPKFKSIRPNMYELSDSIIGVNELANNLDDKNLKKFFKQFKDLHYKLESYLHKNYKGWD
jgi:hypothetical protein